MNHKTVLAAWELMVQNLGFTEQMSLEPRGLAVPPPEARLTSGVGWWWLAFTSHDGPERRRFPCFDTRRLSPVQRVPDVGKQIKGP